jgi:hypothetical protein
MIDFFEPPSIESVERRFDYAQIKWITKSTFTSSLMQINPFIDTDDNGTLDKRLFIGRSSPTHKIPELIGTVLKNEKGDWQLDIFHKTGIHHIKNDFFVLHLNNSRSYIWRSILSSDSLPMPTDALRSINHCEEYFYIGRTIPKYDFKLSDTEPLPNNYDDPLRVMFGNIKMDQSKALYLPDNGLIMKIEKYEVLCLLPSPTSLKNLCRLVIREATNNSNRLISLINKGHESGGKYLPDHLVEFVKYPSFLSNGDYLLKNEKLVDELNQFELFINNKNQFIYRQLDNSDDFKKQSFSNPFAQKTKSFIEKYTPKFLIKHPNDYNANTDIRLDDKFKNINSIWLHRFEVLFLLNNPSNNNNNKCCYCVDKRKYALTSTCEYKFSIKNQDAIPEADSWEIEALTS